MVNAGRKNKRIQLQKNVKTPDGQGGYASEWATVTTVWAETKRPQLSTQENAGTIVSELTWEIGVRHRSDVRRGWRVLYEGRVFDVEHTYDYGRVDTILVCREVVK